MKRYHISFPSWIRGFDSPRPLIAVYMKLFSPILIPILLIFSFTNLYGNQIAPLYDFYHIIKSPFSSNKQNLINIGIISGITAGLFIFDKQIQDYTQKNKNEKFDQFLYYPEKMGEGGYILATSGLFILTGEIIKNRKVTKLGIYSIEGFLISGIIVTAVKFITGRARPYTDMGDKYFKPFSPKTAFTSFYSGHTTVAFCFASVTAHYVKNSYISALLYSTASLTALARVYHNKHWTSDVFMAAALGILIGKSVIELNEPYVNNIETNDDNIKFTLWREEI